MIGDKIIINSKEYTLKKLITMGEYRKISQINNELSEFTSNLSKEITGEELEKIGRHLSKLTNEQSQVMVDFIADSLGLEQKDIDLMSLPEAVELFNETFKASTQIKKKSETP